ncbi:hypothetical protein H480_13573 [Amycolatopsis vancoresmycina DSM 44592]|uniref:Abortive infection protein-like C-terminal domain-containing protein n=1 Tax=Amycolatopsis vancoresmycina DSM 44592 TaxID=1292037 RepID=R1G9G3_9PSEU|nr:hypothetical protein H480_13573 [Amycolatopsis vancoresmycina DSM 44592]
MIELGGALTPFFEQGLDSPSHDELDRAFERAGLTEGDPRRSSTDPIGKAKRVRAVFIYAADHVPQSGLALAQHLVALCRVKNEFDTDSASCPGLDKIEALRRSFESLGYSLDNTGALRPLVIDNLSGTKLTDALQSYVRRANASPDDAPLQIGNGKDLDEATARHVLEQKIGAYSQNGNFPFTLAQAFLQLGLEPAHQNTAKTLDGDPHKAVQQCLYQLACAVNKLRNEVGTGHGRPSAPSRTTPLTSAEARLVARATALVSGMLLDSL